MFPPHVLTNKCVRCSMIDFAKAFDVVGHAILLGKLQTLGINQFALNWIVSFSLTVVKYVRLMDLILYRF